MSGNRYIAVSDRETRAALARLSEIKLSLDAMSTLISDRVPSCFVNLLIEYWMKTTIHHDPIQSMFVKHLHNEEGDKLAPQPVRVAHSEEPYRADLVLDVDGGRVGLCGSVELRNVLDAEPLHEPLPDGGLEAVAEHDPDFVGGIIGRPWGGQEEPGNLPDVLRRNDVVLDAVLEEVGRGELLFDDGPEVDSTIAKLFW